MSKTKEELNALKEEVEAVRRTLMALLSLETRPIQ